jgi:hypothetical protein
VVSGVTRNPPASADEFVVVEGKTAVLTPIATPTAAEKNDMAKAKGEKKPVSNPIGFMRRWFAGRS